MSLQRFLLLTQLNVTEYNKMNEKELFNQFLKLVEMIHTNLPPHSRPRMNAVSLQTELEACRQQALILLAAMYNVKDIQFKLKSADLASPDRLEVDVSYIANLMPVPSSGHHRSPPAGKDPSLHGSAELGLG